MSLLLALTLLTTLVPARILAAGANSLVESLNEESYLENKAIHVDVSKDSGAFYIRTVAGDKLVKGDENANLLWPSEDDTSFTSVRITRGGVTKDYIFGKDYGEDGNTVAVTNDGTKIDAVWSVDGVTFTQSIRLQPTNNDAHGMVVISYSAANTGAAAEIGVRVLLDTAMGGKDYAYYNTGDSANPVMSERELGTDGYNKSIYMMDDPADPLVTGYILNGSVDSEECKPVKTVLAHWANLASTVYDYTPDPTLNFTNAFNAQHLTSDSAVALYYSLGSVAQGGEASALLNYGLYSNEKANGEVAVNLQTIDALSYTDASETAFENGGRFTARTILQNASQKTYEKVRVYAYASGGITVLNSNGEAVDDAGKPYGYSNPYYVEINGFAPRQKVNNLSDWSFQATMTAEANYGRVHFKVYDMSNNSSDTPSETDLIGEAKKYILVPGSQEKLPSVRFTGSAPSAFFTEGHRVFNITGMKFASLEQEADEALYELKLSRKDGGVIRDGETVLVLNKAAFTINEDSSGMMSVTIDGELPVGEYKLTLDYTDSGRQDLSAKALEFQIVDDTRYRCETYGLVAVYRVIKYDNEGRNPRMDYLVETCENEAMFEEWKKREKMDETDILMIFRGTFDDLTNSLPDGALDELDEGESYDCYVVATLTDDPNSAVNMSNCLNFKYHEQGSNVTIKVIGRTDESDEFDKSKYNVKVDFNCKITTSGTNTPVFSGVSCFTELKADKRYGLIQYDSVGERNDTVDNSIALLWSGYGVVNQYLAGLMFDFRYAELGAMYDDNGSLMTRTVGFGAGLDLSCIIPSAPDVEDEVPSEGRMSAEEIRQWNETNDIRRESRSFSEKNKDRAGENVANGFYDDDDNYKFSGKVQVSDVLFGSNSFLGFNFCIGVGIPPLGYNMPSMEGVFTLRTIGQVEFRVNGELQFEVLGLEGLLDLKANQYGILIPDEFKFFISDVTPGIPLDPFGVFWLQGGGGGIKDIYETIYLQDKVPPIKLILQAQFSVMQVMAAKATVELGLTGFGVALSDVKIPKTGVVVIDSIVVAMRWYPNFALISSLQVDILDCIQGGGYIVGYSGANPFFEAFARAALHLPGNVPIVGGMTIGAVNMGISTERIFGGAEVIGIKIGVSYYWTNEFDWGAKNEANPTFPELLGLGSEFDTDIDEMFEDIPTGEEEEDDEDGGKRSLSLMGASARGLGAVPVYYDAENDRTLMAVAGTNLDADNTLFLLGDEEPEESGSLENTLQIAPDGKKVEAAFADNSKSKVLLLKWTSESEAEAQAQARALSITPTGDTFALSLVDHERDAAAQNANANLSYDEDTKKATLAVSVTESSLTALTVESDVALDAVLYDVNPLPALDDRSSATLSGSTLSVNLAGTSLDSFDYVNVALVKRSELALASLNADYVPEIVLVDRIDKDSGHMPTYNATELPADLPSGDYVVRLMAQDEAQTVVSQIDLTGSEIDFTNPNTPAAPVSIGDVASLGDWLVSVPIDAGGTDDFDGYELTVTDADGATVSGLTDMLFYKNGETAVYSEGGSLTVPEGMTDAGRLVIGGHFAAPVSQTDEDGKVTTSNEDTLTQTEIIGFADAGSYTVSVRKWKAVDGVLIYSDALTKAFTVSAPAPADVSITGVPIKARAVERGAGCEETFNVPFYTGDVLELTLSADKSVTGTWVLDELTDTDGFHGEIADATEATIDLRALELAEGVHNIAFLGKTADGDTSSASYSFGVDNTAPELLISAPENGGVFDGVTGVVSFTGMTDPGAFLSLYDATTRENLEPEAFSINKDTGGFVLTVKLDGGVSSHLVKLTAADDLGNSSERNFTLSSSLLPKVTSLHLYEGDRDVTELPLDDGEHILRLVGKTSDGETVELNDPSLIEWEARTLEGPALNAAPSKDGTRFIVDAEPDTVGVITGKLLVSDDGAYPVSCMVGSTLSVGTKELTLGVGEEAILSVSSQSGAALTYASADETVATVSVDADGVATVTGVKAGVTTVTVTSSTGDTATVTVTVAEARFRVGSSGNTTHSLTLDGGKIGVNFYVDPLNTDVSRLSVGFAYDGKTVAPVALSEYTVGDNTYYRAYCHVNSKQMTKTITATLYLDGESTGQTDEYSVLGYYETMSGNTSLSDVTRELIDAIITYGSYAEQYFDGSTTAPAPTELTTIPEAFKPATATGEAPVGVTVRGVTLLLDTDTYVRLYFDLADDRNVEEYTFRVDDQTVTPKASASNTSANGKYYLTVEHIQSYLLDASHTFEISDGTNTYSRSYAPLNYAYNQQDNGDLGSLVKALYQYYLKSSAYRNSTTH